MTSLDVDAVRTFVMVADLQSFTRAAAALGSTQATISVKLRRLEEKLGARLIERTPRRVSLSAKGAVFLPSARDFLAAHERAMAEFAEAPCRLALGFVDHVAGPELSVLIAQLLQRVPQLDMVSSPRLGCAGQRRIMKRSGPPVTLTCGCSRCRAQSS